MLTHARLLQLVSYDPEAGVFTRTAPGRKVRVGDRAGHLNRDGYRYVRVDGKRYQEHRLAWFYITGRWPETDIDHRDLNKANNAWMNLREATRSQNMHNTEAPTHNTSGSKGVCFDALNGKWMAYTYMDGRFINFGRFPLKDDAIAAHAAGVQRLFGDFARCTQASAEGNPDNLNEPRRTDGLGDERTPGRCEEAPLGNPQSVTTGQLRETHAASTFATN